MKNKKHTIRKATLVIIFLLISVSSFAQTLPVFDDSVDDTTPAPISSIIALGLIAGAAYGIRKVK